MVLSIMLTDLLHFAKLDRPSEILVLYVLDYLGSLIFDMLRLETMGSFFMHWHSLVEYGATESMEGGEVSGLKLGGSSLKP